MKELRSLTELIESFSKLPGIGVKSAERMAYAVLRMKEEDRDDFVKAIKDVSSNIHPCPVCGLYTEDEKCCTAPLGEVQGLSAEGVYRDTFCDYHRVVFAEL